MKTLIPIALLAAALGCTSRSTTVRPEQTQPPSAAVPQLKSDFGAADFKAAIIGEWNSVFTYKNRSNIQSLKLTADGHATLVVAETDSSQKQYSGAYAVTFDREPGVGAVTFATITIKPKDAPEVILSRVTFGLHNGINIREGIVLRIDQGPHGVLKRTN